MLNTFHVPEKGLGTGTVLPFSTGPVGVTRTSELIQLFQSEDTLGALPLCQVFLSFAKETGRCGSPLGIWAHCKLFSRERFIASSR